MKENYKKAGIMCNSIASIITILMGISHFFVPFIFPWTDVAKDMYPPIKWALFAMNFFFSFLLTWGGILSLVSLHKWYENRGVNFGVIGGLGLFWFVGAIYEILYPFPFEVVRWVLPSIALLISFLYGISLYFYVKKDKKEKSKKII